MISESPRWLIATGRHEKAVKVIQKIAEANGKSVPEEVLNPNTLGTINENQKRMSDTNCDKMEILCRFISLEKPPSDYTVRF